MPTNAPHLGAMSEMEYRPNELLHLVFSAWRNEVPATPIRLEWRRDRCMVMHMCEPRGPFAAKLQLLWGSLTSLFTDTGAHATHKVGLLWKVAAKTLPWASLKHISHSGAIRVRPSRRRYVWQDPGNFVYAVSFHLLVMTARHMAKCGSQDHRRPGRDAAVSMVMVASEAIAERWTRELDSRNGMELLGDLWEYALGMGYDLEEWETVIHHASPFIERVHDIRWFIKENAAFSRARDLRFEPAGLTARKLAGAILHSINSHLHPQPDRDGVLQFAKDARLVYS